VIGGRKGKVAENNPQNYRLTYPATRSNQRVGECSCQIQWKSKSQAIL